MGLLFPYQVCQSQSISIRSPKRVMLETNQNLHKTTSSPPTLDLNFSIFMDFLIKTCKNHRKHFYQNANIAEINKKNIDKPTQTPRSHQSNKRKLEDRLFENSTKHPKPSCLITATVHTSRTYMLTDALCPYVALIMQKHMRIM